MARLDYLELAANDLATTKAFYENALGLKFTDFGDSYSATTTDDTDIGLYQTNDTPPPPLGVIHVDDLEKYLEQVKSAGGQIILDIFSFPGGRRFEFLDPSNNRIGVWEKS